MQRLELLFGENLPHVGIVGGRRRKDRLITGSRGFGGDATKPKARSRAS
jgi:hypothetical protein